ncbi:MAG: 2-oxoacid:acceptor oxidoreductase family protein, partial [Coriobacteriales bacterium]|nr:2-oxoacid:acceptor oxidoreductase family protein [Coriobacteriales bacterium]
MTRSIVLSGIGGQGTVLASRLIASVALSRGVPVRTAETIGMAQRGGTVLTHVRYGDTPTDVPHTSLVPLGAASLAIAFEPGEAQRVLPYLAPDAAMVVARRAIPPTTATLAGVDYDGSEQLAYLKQ